jgi:hypothetical protein
MSYLAIQCIGKDCPPYWIPSSGTGFDETSSGRIAITAERAIAKLRGTKFVFVAFMSQGSEAMTLGHPLDELRNSLSDLYREYSQPDWDGYGAHAITEDAYFEAQKLIDALPSWLPTPEIVAEPTGGIGFEWFKDRGQVFALSVGGRHRITYAGIFSGDKEHGSVYFEETMPLLILQHLRKLYL